MSPTSTTLPLWQQTLEAHPTWAQWTAALRTDWTPEGVTLRDVPAAWDPALHAPELHRPGHRLPPPRFRLWTLARHCLRRTHRVSMVETHEPQTLQLRIKEK